MDCTREQMPTALFWRDLGGRDGGWERLGIHSVSTSFDFLLDFSPEFVLKDRIPLASWRK